MRPDEPRPSCQEGQLYSVGVHPWDTGVFDPQLLRREASRSDVVAIGETGLDKLRGLPMSEQIARLKTHILLSEQLGKPLILHCVKGYAGLIGLKRKLRPKQLWIVHGFRGKPQLYEQLSREGIYVSLGERFNEATAQLIPDDRLLIESDESPEDISQIAARIAEVRGVSSKHVLSTAAANLQRLMHIPKKEPAERKIIIACDSFKGSLTADEVCAAVAEGVKSALGGQSATVICLPMADGGEGTGRIITRALNGREIEIDTLDASGHPIKASYGVLPEGRAVIELAAASGLTLIEPHMRNPERCSTYGTGLMIKDAIERGCHDITLCLGGSATNDAATGLLDGLGVAMAGANGRRLTPNGGNLADIKEILIPEALKKVRFTLACDVTNPFYGPSGAAYVFAPQKGADSEMVERLDHGLRTFATLLHSISGIDPQSIAGSGAAGGVAGTMVALLGARILPGAKMVAGMLRLDEAMTHACLAITGEGRIDSQTLGGKAPMTVLEAGMAYGVQVMAVAGKVEDRPRLLKAGFSQVIETSPRSMALTEAMDPVTARENIAVAVKAVIAKLF